MHEVSGDVYSDSNAIVSYPGLLKVIDLEIQFLVREDLAILKAQRLIWGHWQLA